jgi:hypothetical protein
VELPSRRIEFRRFSAWKLAARGDKWRKLFAKNRSSGDILQADRHHRCAAIDVYLAEELQPGVRREIRLPRFRRPLEHHLRAEGIIQGIRAKGAGVEGPGDKLPERVELLRLGRPRVVVMGRAIVDVGREPHDILDPFAFEEAQNLGNVELPA